MKPMQPNTTLQTTSRYQKHFRYEEAFIFSKEERTDAQLSAMEELIWITWPRLLAGEDSKSILAASGTPPASKVSVPASGWKAFTIGFDAFAQPHFLFQDLLGRGGGRKGNRSQTLSYLF